MKLYEEYEAIRDKFEVLAFHDDRAKTFEELDEKLERVREKRWEGKTLPFPILLDATGKTVDDYGITSFPTHVLIDPEGRVVRGHGERNLKKKLEELVPAEPEEMPQADETAPEPTEEPQDD